MDRRRPRQWSPNWTARSSPRTRRRFRPLPRAGRHREESYCHPRSGRVGTERRQADPAQVGSTGLGLTGAPSGRYPATSPNRSCARSSRPQRSRSCRTTLLISPARRAANRGRAHRRRRARSPTARPPQAAKALAGGFGYLLGDEGSAFDIGLAAISAACRAEDRRGESNSLRQMVLVHFGIARIRESRVSSTRRGSRASASPSSHPRWPRRPGREMNRRYASWQGQVTSWPRRRSAWSANCSNPAMPSASISRAASSQRRCTTGRSLPCGAARGLAGR